uniref:Uncharacterized protein n=1 Tax=Trypanosoma vivax (strain Y486) TaxID=1055687 RepID=G0TRR1_TRYVY|nr:conserved hypothetical protein [Trypanosoma vivax Y486]
MSSWYRMRSNNVLLPHLHQIPLRPSPELRVPVPECLVDVSEWPQRKRKHANGRRARARRHASSAPSHIRRTAVAHSVLSAHCTTTRRHFLPTRTLSAYDDIVLTPSTLLDRLRAVFPPTPVKALQARSESQRLQGPVFTSNEVRQVPFQSGEKFFSSVVSLKLRPCCQPVPWEDVILRRMDTELCRYNSKDGNAVAGAVPEKPAGGNWKCRDVPCVHSTPAVYNVFVPCSFLLSHKPHSKTLAGTNWGTMSSTEEGRKFVNKSGPCYSGQDTVGSPRAFHTRSSFMKKRMKLPVPSQHVAILHHIPGLPDLKEEELTLYEFVAHVNKCRRVHEGLGEGRSCGEPTHESLSGRLHELEALKTRVRSRKNAMKCDSSGNGDPFSGTVGVWIIHPYRESIFFAVRYDLGSDDFEWVCRPQHVLWQSGSVCEDQETALRCLSPSLARGLGVESAVLPLSWASGSLQQAMRFSSPSPSQGARNAKRIVFPTILYHYAAGTVLTVSEQLTLIEHLLGCTKAGDTSIEHNSLLPCSRIWAPLHRAALRQRAAAVNPQVLAEAMKYGTLRLLHRTLA